MSFERSMPAASQAALARFRALLTPDQIDATPAPRRGTTGAIRQLAGILRPCSVAEIQAIVEIAAATDSPLYPVSTGRNWGYGDDQPAIDGCFLVDLSAMNRILDCDVELGVVTVEPGVTQGQLRAWLDARGLRLMVPVTGAGPDCSLVGNALERGFGITPHADHFGAVTALEAVLPDGRRYRSSFGERGASAADRAFKWGIGPYLDGLFAQGGFGIVTQLSLALAPRPEAICAFVFSVADDEGLGIAVEAVRRLLRLPGLSLSGINLMSAHRVLAMLEPYPADADGVVSDHFVARGRRRHRLGAWTGIGALYGSPRSLGAARDAVRDGLQAIDPRPQFFDDRTIAQLDRLVRHLPARWTMGLHGKLTRARSLMQVLEGTPTTAALALAYWRTGAPALPTDRPPDPARDGCGLIWYAPVVPMTATMVGRFVALAREITIRHGFNPLITLTSLSDRAFDGTVPIVFRRVEDGTGSVTNADEAARACACYAALMTAGRAAGLLPYRVTIDGMRALADDPDSTFWRLVGDLKATIDPRGIMAPGRYAPLPQKKPPVG
jgi:FAD/FMN-containing dehydrogenase